MAAVAAALANWNGAAYVEPCLAALEGQTRRVDEVVVVDNGSNDGSDAWIAVHHPGVRLLRNEHNEGFCAGYNRAIAASRAPYVLVVNTDVFLDPGFVAATAAVLDDHLDTAAVTGRIFEAATQRTISGGFRLRRSLRMRPSPAAAVEEEAFGASGAAVLFRRQALVEAAGPDGQIYDERFFSYGEDIDLAWRLRALGWKARYTPVARAHHVGSGSLGGALRFLDKPAFFQRHAWKNRYLTLVKNAPASLWPELVVACLLSDLALLACLSVRQPRRVPYLLGGALDVLRLWPSTWAQRQALGRRARHGGAAVRPWLHGW